MRIIRSLMTFRVFTNEPAIGNSFRNCIRSRPHPVLIPATPRSDRPFGTHAQSITDWSASVGQSSVRSGKLLRQEAGPRSSGVLVIPMTVPPEFPPRCSGPNRRETPGCFVWDGPDLPEASTVPAQARPVRRQPQCRHRSGKFPEKPAKSAPTVADRDSGETPAECRHPGWSFSLVRCSAFPRPPLPIQRRPAPVPRGLGMPTATKLVSHFGSRSLPGECSKQFSRRVPSTYSPSRSAIRGRLCGSEFLQTNFGSRSCSEPIPADSRSGRLHPCRTGRRPRR